MSIQSKNENGEQNLEICLFHKAFPSCDADASETFLVLVSEVVSAYDLELFESSLSAMVLTRYSKKHILAENWQGDGAGLQ